MTKTLQLTGKVKCTDIDQFVDTLPQNKNENTYTTDVTWSQNPPIPPV